MQNLLENMTKEYKGFIDEWQPHQNCSDFWSLYSILKDGALGGSVYALSVIIRHIRTTFDSLFEVFCSLTDVTCSRTWERRYLIPHAIRSKKKDLYFDHNSFLCGDKVQLLLDSKAMAVRVDLGGIRLDLCAETTNATQWMKEENMPCLKSGRKSIATLMGGWTPHLRCAGKLFREEQTSLRLQGVASFERLWGQIPIVSAQVHWEKFYLFLDNGTEVVLLDFPYGKKQYSTGFSLQQEKEISPLSNVSVQVVDFLEMDEWRFSSGWRVNISDNTSFYFVPLVREQFVMAVPRPIVGVYDQSGKQLGYGFSELTPGARNELRRIPLKVYYKYWKENML